MLIMDIDKERQMLRFEHGQQGYESRDIKNHQQSWSVNAG